MSLCYHFECPLPDMAKVPKMRSLLSVQYLQKSVGDEVGFLSTDKLKVFCKLIVLLLVCISRHAQNNMFAISLQCLKENMKDEVIFLLADKCQSFLQIHTIILGVCGQACPNTANNKFTISLHYLQKEMSDKVDFLHADKR